MMTQTQRVLLVEDDKMLGLLLERKLQVLGYEVELASTGFVALRRLQEKEFDAVLLDVLLPDMDGIELLKRQAHVLPPTILMTAEPSLDMALGAFQLGVVNLLPKPFRDSELEAALKKATAVQPKLPPRRVLAVGAHPDDIEIGCGGALILERQQGAEVGILVLSSGAQGGASRLREDEARRAAERLGAQIWFGRLPDTEVSPGSSTIQVIEDVVGQFGPSVLLTHTNSDLHQDHRAAHQASLVAARGVETVLCYQSPSTNVEFHPNAYRDISTTFEKKIELIRCHHSQADCRPYLEEDLIRSTARYWGRFSGFGLVEPFEVLREASSVFGDQRRTERPRQKSNSEISRTSLGQELRG